MKIYPVILSGGSGTRLWPLSRAVLPKQLLPLVTDKTMLQETALRLAGWPEMMAPLLICGDEHRFLVAEQMRDIAIAPLAIMLESVGRNTAPAVAAAAWYLQALDPQARTDARLSEINFGDWEGRAWDAIERDALDAWAADMLNFIPPGGESPGQLQQRCIDFVSTLDLPSVVLVSHAGVIRSLLGYWRGLTIKEWTQIPCDFGSLTTINVRATK